MRRQRTLCLHVLSSFQRTELFCPTLARWFALRGTFQLYDPSPSLSTKMFILVNISAGSVNSRQQRRSAHSNFPDATSRDFPRAGGRSAYRGRRSCPGLTSVAYLGRPVNTGLHTFAALTQAALRARENDQPHGLSAHFQHQFRPAGVHPYGHRRDFLAFQLHAALLDLASGLAA